MGTSDAYKGTPGWHAVRQHTEAWVESRTEPGTGAAARHDPERAAASRRLRLAESEAGQSHDPLLIRLMGGLARMLIQVLFESEPDVVIVRGDAVPRAYGRRAAARSGSLAIAATYELRSGGAGSAGGETDILSDAGLSYEDMLALSPFRQAQMIVDAVSGSSSLLGDAELREVNARVVCWGIEREPSPSASDLVRKWVIEYVLRIWLTETGRSLRDGSLDGESTRTLEREARAVLEELVNDTDLPVDSASAQKYATAIQELLLRIRDIERYIHGP